MSKNKTIYKNDTFLQRLSLSFSLSIDINIINYVIYIYLLYKYIYADEDLCIEIN